MNQVGEFILDKGYLLLREIWPLFPEETKDLVKCNPVVDVTLNAWKNIKW